MSKESFRKQITTNEGASGIMNAFGQQLGPVAMIPAVYSRSSCRSFRPCRCSTSSAVSADFKRSSRLRLDKPAAAGAFRLAKPPYLRQPCPCFSVGAIPKGDLKAASNSAPSDSLLRFLKATFVHTFRPPGGDDFPLPGFLAIPANRRRVPHQAAQRVRQQLRGSTRSPRNRQAENHRAGDELS